MLHGINEYTVALAKAQSLFGTYGHGGENLTADGRLHRSIPWYGPVNQAGIVANLTIVMDKKESRSSSPLQLKITSGHASLDDAGFFQVR